MAKKRKPSDEVMAAQCFGKHRYDSAVVAHSVAKQQRRRDEESRVVVYRCQTCTGWHIGNKRPKSYCKEREE